MDEGKTLFRTVGIDKWGKIIAHKGKGYQLDYTGWEPMEMKVFPRRKGDPTEEWPISRNPENLKYTEDSQGILEFPKPPKVSESGTSIDFTVEVTEKKDKLALLMPKLKAREAVYHMNMEVELDLKLKTSGATVSLDTMRAAMQQAIGATVPGPMARIAQSFVSPKVRDRCNLYVQFPPPYIWHPFVQDDKLSQPNANQPSRNDPKYTASIDQERTAYILDTTTDEWTTCAAELRKFNPDNQLYRVTDEVMDFNFNTIAHQDILQTDGPRDHCGFTLRTNRAILGRPREPNEMACTVETKRKKEFSKFPESPARNDGENCAIFYKWVEQITIRFVLHFTDKNGKKIELFNGTRPIKHEQFEIGFKIENLPEDQTVQLAWDIVEGHPRIMKEGSLFTKRGVEEETLTCAGDQIWKTKILLVNNPVNEAPLILIPVKFELKADKLMLLVNKQGWAGSRMTLSRDIADHQEIYKQISSGKAYFEIRILNPYLDEFGSDQPGLRDEFWVKQVLFPEIEFYKDLELFGNITTQEDGRTFLTFGEAEDQGTVLEFKSDEVANNYKGSLKLEENVLKIYDDLKYGFEKLALVADKIKPGEKEILENQLRKYRPEFFKLYLKEKSPFVKDHRNEHEGAAKYIVGMVKYSIPQPRILLDLIEMHNRAISDAFGAALNVVIDFAFFLLSFVSWFWKKLYPAAEAAAAAQEATEEGVQQASREAGEQASRAGGGTVVGEGTEAATRTTVGEAIETAGRESGEQATRTGARELGDDAAETGLHPESGNVISFDSIFGETAGRGRGTVVTEGTEAATRTTVSEAGEQASRVGGGTVVGEGTEAATHTTIREAGEKGAQQAVSRSVRAIEAQVRQLQRELAEAQAKITTAKGTETAVKNELGEVVETLARSRGEIGKWKNVCQEADKLIDKFQRQIREGYEEISALMTESGTATGNRRGVIQETIQQTRERIQHASACLAEVQANKNKIIDGMLQEEIVEHGLKTHEKTLTDQLTDVAKKIGDEREHVRELQYQINTAIENLDNARRAVPPIGIEPPQPRIPPTEPRQPAGLPGTSTQPPSGGTWAEIANWLSKAINAIKRFAVWLSNNVVTQYLFGEKSRFSNGFTGSLIQWLMDWRAKGVVSEPLNPSMDWIDPSLAENNEAYMNKDFRDKEKTRLLNKALQEIQNSKKNIPWKFCECLETNLAMAVDLAIERKSGDRGEKVEDRCKKFTYNFIHLIKEEYKAEYRSTSYLGWNPSTVGNVGETWRDLEHALDYILFFVSWGIRVKAVVAAGPTGGVSLAALAIADFVDLVKSSLVLLMASLGDSLSKAKMVVAVTNYPALVLAWIQGADDEEKCENLPFHLNSFSQWASHLNESLSQDRIQEVLALKMMKSVDPFKAIPWFMHIGILKVK